MAKRRYRYEESHRTVNGVKQKRCTKCEQWKSESRFHKDRKSKDGLSSWCGDCGNEYGRKRYDQHRKTTKRYCKYEQSHRVVDGVKQKRCSKCKKWKAESKFYKIHRHKDGLAVWCKECSDRATNESHRKRRLAVRN